MKSRQKRGGGAYDESVVTINLTRQQLARLEGWTLPDREEEPQEETLQPDLFTHLRVLATPAFSFAHKRLTRSAQFFHIPYIYIDSRRGIIYFNRTASRMLGYSPHEQAVFYQDFARPKDWYVKASVSSPERTDGPGLICHSELAGRIAASCSLPPACWLRLSLLENWPGIYSVITCDPETFG